MKVIKTMNIEEVSRLAEKDGWSYSRPYKGELEDGSGGKMWTVYEDPKAGEFVRLRVQSSSRWPWRWAETPVQKEEE